MQRVAIRVIDPADLVILNGMAQLQSLGVTAPADRTDAHQILCKPGIRAASQVLTQVPSLSGSSSNTRIRQVISFSSSVSCEQEEGGHAGKNCDESDSRHFVDEETGSWLWNKILRIWHLLSEECPKPVVRIC